jgi:hypothetical protein
MVAAEYLHAARRDPAAEYLQCRRHASSSSSGFDPAAGDMEPLPRPLILAVGMCWEFVAGVRSGGGGARVASEGLPPTRTLAQYKYGAAGWKCRAPYSADTGQPEYRAC